MKKIFLTFLLIAFGSVVFAESITVAPCEKIKTTTKYFRIGDSYKFKNIKTGEKYTATVTYYRPNGFFGQEAQVEFNNFIDENNQPIAGKISIIPSNHKKLQDFGNYSSAFLGGYIRGSEIILKPKKHTFLLNENTPKYTGYIMQLRPAEELSTAYDEIEVKDKIKFINQKDVYKNGKLYLKAQSKIFGIVDYVDENGWCADNAVIHIKKFVTQDVDGNDIAIYSNLDINGFELLKYKAKHKRQFFNYISTIARGKEVDIKTYDKDIYFNVVVEEKLSN